MFAKLVLWCILGHVLGANIDWCAKEFECVDAKGHTIINSMCMALSHKDKLTTHFEVNNFNNRWLSSDPSLGKIWLALANTLRDRIAAGTVYKLPPASNMKQLVWDATLAEQAHVYASVVNQIEDDPCNASPVGGPIGPVAGRMRKEYHYKKVTRNTLNQIFTKDIEFLKQFTSPDIAAFNHDIFAELGNLEKQRAEFLIYTIMGGQRLMGASMATYMWGSFYEYSNINTYWSPEKFYESPQTLYREGEPCSFCPPGYQCNKKSTYKHLCAESNDSATEEYVDYIKLPGRFTPYKPGSYSSTSKQPLSATVSSASKLASSFVSTLAILFFTSQVPQII